MVASSTRRQRWRPINGERWSARVAMGSRATFFDVEEHYLAQLDERLSEGQERQQYLIRMLQLLHQPTQTAIAGLEAMQASQAEIAERRHVMEELHGTVRAAIRS